ncbi:EAL domain-containing protein [Grimontia sp. S25]|uniref:EAL domain-containing protein n=1 Tax=Grimontia sedimenti TaxID=2711294 RepID=A0A6M1R7U0_9GAMM|nr:EAL domain-containing protein [Grimontia sedimenti]NGN98445.1 EAL domain-containing protein [Grimontia sedimenti]
MTITNKITLVVATTLLCLCTAMAYAEFTVNLAFIKQEMQFQASSAMQNLSAALVPILETGDLDKSERFFETVMNEKTALSQVTLQWLFDGDLQTWSQEVAISQPAPEWFVAFDLIQPIWLTKTVTNSWTDLATLSILVETDNAYSTLWQLFRSFLISSIILITAATLVVRYTTARMLSPVKTITHEAKRIAKLDFSNAVPAPKTSDLSELTTAFNDMSLQLQNLFETLNEEISSLQKKYLYDDASSLPNRSFLIRQTESWLLSGDCGVLMLINLKWLENTDPKQGTKNFNECIRSMGQSIERILEHTNDSLVARTAKYEIAVVIPSIHEQQAREHLRKIIRAINSEIIINGLPIANGFAIGVAERNGNDSVSSLIERANIAKNQADTESTVFAFSQTTQEHSQEQLDEKLVEALQNDTFEYMLQPVFATASHEIQQYEVFTRLQLGDNAMGANKWLSDLSRLSIAQRFDRCVVKKLVTVLKSDKEIAPLSINLTSDSIKDPDFIIWLIDTITTNKLENRLYFEFAEAIACNHPEDCELACRSFNEAGIRFGIDRFGQHLASVSYLRALEPHFVKLDHSFIQNRDGSSDHLLLLKPIIKMASSLGIEVIASSIEYKHQLSTLPTSNIDAYFGFIAPPFPLESLNEEMRKSA